MCSNQVAGVCHMDNNNLVCIEGTSYFIRLDIVTHNILFSNECIDGVVVVVC